MAVTGGEPISAENLGAVLDGAGYPSAAELFSGASSTVTLPRDWTSYSALVVSLSRTQAMSTINLSLVAVPSTGKTSFDVCVPYDQGSNSARVNLSGATVQTSSSWSITSVIGLTF